MMYKRSLPAESISANCKMFRKRSLCVHVALICGLLDPFRSAAEMEALFNSSRRWMSVDESCQIPVLILTGTQGLVAVTEAIFSIASKAAKERDAGLVSTLIEAKAIDGGMAVHEEYPQETFSHVDSFLKSISSGGGTTMNVQ